MRLHRSSRNYWYQLLTSVDISSAALPRAELAASKFLRLKNASQKMFASLPHLLPALLCARCWLLMENTFQNKLCWLFRLLRKPALCTGCQWRLPATRGSSSPVWWQGWPRPRRAAARDALPSETTAAAPAVHVAAECFPCKVVVLIFMRGSI